MKRPGGGATLLLLLLLLVPELHANSPYPTIARPDRSDPLYQQHQRAIQAYYRAAAQGEVLPPLRIYRYTLDGEESLHAVAARFSLPTESLATLNRIPSPAIPTHREYLLVPSLPGLFLAEAPENRLESFLAEERRETAAELRPLSILMNGKRVTLRFLPEARLSGSEQRHFLGSFFRSPLTEAVITSRFGYRSHPVFGFRTFHRGVDFRSPRGANVFVAAPGEVTEIGRDGVLGVYVTVEHAGGYQTRYAHLSEVTVSLKDALLSGSIIGKVGNTGISTGPHLHFEIIQRDRHIDPLALLPPISE